MATSILLLALLLIILPLQLSWKGKTSILFSSLIISFLCYFGSTIFSIWVIFPMMILLAALLAYMIIKRIDVFRIDDILHNQQNNHSMIEPLFSYEQLKESAEHAETIDSYYMESTQLERLDKEETNSVFGIGTMDQAEIDRLLGFGKEEITVNKDFDDGEKHPILEASWVDEVVDELNHTQDNHIDTLEERAFEADEEKQLLNASKELFVSEDEIETLLKEEDTNPVRSQIDSIDEINIEDITRVEPAEIQEEALFENEELDLIKIRKKLFANLDEGTDDHLSFDEEHVVHTQELEADIPLQRNIGFEDDLEETFLNKEESPLENEKADHNPFTNREVAAAFDDLEDLYLKRKNEENEEEAT